MPYYSLRYGTTCMAKSEEMNCETAIDLFIVDMQTQGAADLVIVRARLSLDATRPRRRHSELQPGLRWPR